MKVRLLGFGSIEVDGRNYGHDIVIDGGRVRKGSKKPSKRFRDEFGHTPLSADEDLPWGGCRLIIGTSAVAWRRQNPFEPVPRLAGWVAWCSSGTGHIGSYLVPRLVRAGLDVVAPSRGNGRPTGRHRNGARCSG